MRVRHTLRVRIRVIALQLSAVLGRNDHWYSSIPYSLLRVVCKRVRLYVRFMSLVSLVAVSVTERLPFAFRFGRRRIDFAIDGSAT